MSFFDTNIAPYPLTPGVPKVFPGAIMTMLIKKHDMIISIIKHDMELEIAE